MRRDLLQRSICKASESLLLLAPRWLFSSPFILSALAGLSVLTFVSLSRLILLLASAIGRLFLMLAPWPTPLLLGTARNSLLPPTRRASLFLPFLGVHASSPVLRSHA